MKTTGYKNGFTLIELLVAMMITGIVASAVATLAYAMNSAGVATDDMSQKEAQIRFARLKISDMIRDCKLICYASATEMAIWTADMNPADGKINIGELTYIDSGASRNCLQLWTFTPTNTAAIPLSTIGPLSTNWWSTYGTKNSPATALIPPPKPGKLAQCKDVTFSPDPDGVVSPPKSKIVSITFNLVENRISSKVQINAALRARAANLLDGSGNIVGDDD